jgi:hypothetical protein
MVTPSLIHKHNGETWRIWIHQDRYVISAIGTRGPQPNEVSPVSTYEFVCNCAWRNYTVHDAATKVKEAVIAAIEAGSELQPLCPTGQHYGILKVAI